MPYTTTTKESMVAACSMNKMIAMAKAKGYYKSGRHVAKCPKCEAEAVVFKCMKKQIHACVCGWRYFEESVYVAKVAEPTPKPSKARVKKATTKPKKTSTRSKAKEMINPGMPINM